MKPEEVAELHAASAASDAAIAHGSFGIGKGGLEGKVVCSGSSSAFRSPAPYGRHWKATLRSSNPSRRGKTAWLRIRVVFTASQRFDRWLPVSGIKCV
jgi:hypothetical protein